MEKTRAEIRVSPTEWSAHGADRVEFLISPNQGEELRPLEKIAGWAGRRARCRGWRGWKNVARRGKVQKGDIPRTLVFDEVDAGVGGSAAESVGRRLKKLSGAEDQVSLCQTHLPQIAGFGDHFGYFVEELTRNVGVRSRRFRN